MRMFEKRAVCSIPYRHAFKTSYQIFTAQTQVIYFINSESAVPLSGSNMFQSQNCISLLWTQENKCYGYWNKRPIKAAWRMTVVLRWQAEFP